MELKFHKVDESDIPKNKTKTGYANKLFDDFEASGLDMIEIEIPEGKSIGVLQTTLMTNKARNKRDWVKVMRRGGRLFLIRT